MIFYDITRCNRRDFLASVRNISAISPYKVFGENLGGLVMSFYKSLVKIMLMPTVLVSIACTSHPTISPTPALESELTLTQKLQNTLVTIKSVRMVKKID